MSRRVHRDPWGARLALWWTDVLTRTAPLGVAVDRRDEIRSDVHEQVVDGRTKGVRARRLSRAIAMRVILGAPADVAWRAQTEWDPHRLGWHLQHPSTAITTLFVAMLPLGLLTNVSEKLQIPHPVHELSWLASLVLSWCCLGFASAAACWRLRPGPRRKDDWLPGLGRRMRVRRLMTAVMGVSAALSAVGRFSESPSVSVVSAVAWAAFGLSVAGYLLLLTTSAMGRVSRS